MISRKILENAIYAPSGDNIQPWKFRISQNTIDIFNVPQADDSLYNFRQSASFIAHGALIENVTIMADALGYKADVTVFPDKKKLEHTAHVEIVKARDIDNENVGLAQYIKLRATNRKVYKDLPLTATEKAVLLHAASRFTGTAQLKMIDDKSQLKALTVATSKNEQLVFSNRILHDFFFKHLQWTPQEIINKIGFDVKTLELPPPGVVAFKLFKNWPLVTLLNNFGLSKMIGAQARKLHDSAPIMASILIPKYAPQYFIETGRLMQRIWLEATRLELSLQPITGILFFKQRIQAGEDKALTSEQKAIINESYGIMENVFGAQGMPISFIFRIGKSEGPSTRTTRAPLDSMIISS